MRGTRVLRHETIPEDVFFYGKRGILNHRIWQCPILRQPHLGMGANLLGPGSDRWITLNWSWHASHIEARNLDTNSFVWKWGTLSLVPWLPRCFSELKWSPGFFSVFFPWCFSAISNDKNDVAYLVFPPPRPRYRKDLPTLPSTPGSLSRALWPVVSVRN